MLVLHRQHVAAMDPADLMQLGGEIMDFFAEGREGDGLPASVDETMADLAMVFHWPPAVMDQMSVAELMGWRARAAKRHNPER